MKAILLRSILILPLLCSMAAACPMCRDSAAVDSGGGSTPPVALFNASVLGILGAFLVVSAFLTVKIASAVRLIDRSHSPSNYEVPRQ